jgi:gluconate 2-dehydrogenase subunit 3-like protein
MDQTSQALPMAGSGPASLLSSDQRALLRAVLNRILPANGPLAAAGELGVGDAVEEALLAAPALRRTFISGLVEIELAAARGGADFAALPTAEQDSLLKAVEAAHPVSFGTLVEHSYRAYYLRPDVHAAIGYDSRPPHPLGYELPPFDEGLLTRQRRREPFWRPTA